MTSERYQRQVDRIEKQMAIVQAQRSDVANTLAEEMRVGNRLERLEEIVAFGHAMLMEPDIAKANAWFRRHWRVWILDNEVRHAEAI